MITVGVCQDETDRRLPRRSSRCASAEHRAQDRRSRRQPPGHALKSRGGFVSVAHDAGSWIAPMGHSLRLAMIATSLGEADAAAASAGPGHRHHCQRVGAADPRNDDQPRRHETAPGIVNPHALQLSDGSWHDEKSRVIWLQHQFNQVLARREERPATTPDEQARGWSKHFGRAMSVKWHRDRDAERRLRRFWWDPRVMGV